MAEEKESTEALDEVKARCEAAGIEYRQEDFLDEDILLEIELPDARETRTVTAIGEERFAQLAAIDFEKYRFLEGYDAIVCYEHGTIECYAERAAGGGNLKRVLTIRLGYTGPGAKRGDGERAPTPDELVKVERGDITLTLGTASEELRLLAGPERGRVALRLTGVDVERHDDARRYLAMLANALFFEIDARAGLPIVISGGRRRVAFAGKRIDPSSLRFPESAFDPEPMSLFWYGRGARGMPLLQFLAFYQVLEFYFPLYSAAEARRRIKLIVGDPRFNTHSSRDIQKVFRAATADFKGSSAAERNQLHATIRLCADPQAIREFISSSRDGIFTKKAKGLTEKLVKDSMDDTELLRAVAERIYEIRCKIVHTKDEEGEEEFGLLLPFSKEADQLGPDIGLIELLARQALIAASQKPDN
jgi:hypothetical protein